MTGGRSRGGGVVTNEDVVSSDDATRASERRGSRKAPVGVGTRQVGGLVRS